MKNTIFSKAVRMVTTLVFSASVMAMMFSAVPTYAKTSYNNFGMVEGRGNKYTTVYTNGADAWINVSVKGDGSGFYLYDENGHCIYGEMNAIESNSNRWFFLGKDHAVYKVYCPSGYVCGSAKITVTKSNDCPNTVIK